MQHGRKYALNTTWILIEKSARIISGLLVGILVARFLGPEQFGILGYALNLAAVFAIVATAGMDGVLTRELVLRKEDTNILMGSALAIRIAGALLAIVVATTYSAMRDSNFQTLIVFVVSASMLFQSFTIIDLYFSANVQGKFNAVNQVVTLTLSSIIKIILIWYQASLIYFSSMLLVESIISTVIQLYFFNKSSFRMRIADARYQECLHLLKASFPFVLSGFIMLVYLKMDFVLIKRFLSLAELGNYNAAVRISEASYFISAAISGAVLPGLLNNIDNKELFKERFTQLMSLLLWIGIVIIIGAFLLGDTVIAFLYKEKYNLAPGVFKIHILSVIPAYLGTLWSAWILAQNKQKLFIYFYIVVFIIAVSLQLYLIPRYGINGAAWAVVGTQYASLLLFLSIYRANYMWSCMLKATNFTHLIKVFQYLKK
jgi:O-antigen/teichoic acid export membrane protein